MEIKITISDTAGGGTTPAPSVQISSEAGPSGTSAQSSAAGGQQEILRAAAAAGAIDAGPAPAVGSGSQFGVPPPFRSSSGASDLETAMPSAGTSAGPSAAAPSGGGSPMETEPAPGDENVF